MCKPATDVEMGKEEAPRPPSSPPPAGTTCWGCGATEDADAPFKACSKCRADGISPPCKFCSQDCLRANWPRHKEWHAEQLQARGTPEKVSTPATSQPELPADSDGISQQLREFVDATFAEREKIPPDERTHMFLILESAKLKEEGKYNRAVKKLEKAISLEPDDATAYFHLGECYGRMNEPSKAAELYLKAMDRYTKTGEGYGCGYQLWASAAVSAIMWMNIPGGESCPRPTWFHDEGLKEISAELLTVIPGDLRVWRNRAFVLCAQPDMPAQWEVGPRTAAEFFEAARCYAKTVEVGETTAEADELRRQTIGRSAYCIQRPAEGECTDGATESVLRECGSAYAVLAKQAGQWLVEPTICKQVVDTLKDRANKCFECARAITNPAPMEQSE